MQQPQDPQASTPTSPAHASAWLTAGATVVNFLSWYAGHSSPHTAMIVGGALGVLQSVLPSIFRVGQQG